MNIEKELKSLAARHGASYPDTVALFERLRSQGADETQALMAIRVGYAMHSGKHEYFSAADVSSALGVSEDEAQAMIEQSPDAMTVTYPDWMQ